MSACAVLSLRALPRFVEDLVRNRFDAHGSEDSAEMFQREGAIRLARSAASWHALDALLCFGLTYRGEVLVSTANAVSDVAVHLAREDRTRVGQILMEVATSTSHETRHRVAAVHALRAIASWNLLDTHSIEALRTAVCDPALPVHTRIIALEACGMFARHGHAGASQVALDVLGRDDCAELVNPALAQIAMTADEALRPALESAAGLDGGGVTSLAKEAAERLTPWSALLLGMLWNRESVRYDAAIAVALRCGSERALWQLEETLDPGSVPVSDVVVGALVARARRSLSPHYMDLAALRLLRRIAPVALVEERWEQGLGEWRAEARSAFADMVGEIASEHTEARYRAVVLLRLLAEDSAYGVRRSAYRALASFEASVLAAFAGDWAALGTIGTRIRAAEAVGWLPASRAAAAARVLARDHDLRVHRAHRRGQREAQTRSLVAEYMKRVLVRPPAPILDVYRYGYAIQELGDDAAERRLREFLEDGELPPNYAYWLTEIARRVGERWKKVTRDWPEPLEALEGNLIDQSVVLLLEGGGEAAARGTIWRRPGRLPDGVDSWGCVLQTQAGGGSLRVLTPEVSVSIGPNLRGRAVVVHQEIGGLVVLQGTGPFPGSLPGGVPPA
jgi:hypothetical protein